MEFYSPNMTLEQRIAALRPPQAPAVQSSPAAVPSSAPAGFGPGGFFYNLLGLGGPGTQSWTEGQGNAIGQIDQGIGAILEPMIGPNTAFNAVTTGNPVQPDNPFAAFGLGEGGMMTAPGAALSAVTAPVVNPLMDLAGLGADPATGQPAQPNFFTLPDTPAAQPPPPASGATRINLNTGTVTQPGAQQQTSDWMPRLQSIATGESARVEGMSDTFGSALDRLTQAAIAAGFDPQMNWGTRTYEEQERLYNDPNVGRAAQPGTSRHEFGEAADFNSGPALDWMHAHAAEYGLEFPFADDAGHAQLIGQRQNQTPFQPMGMPQPPELQAPDYSASREALAGAAPETDPDALWKEEFWNFLGGLAAGAGASNWAETGVGAGLAQMASGGYAANEDWRATQRDANQQWAVTNANLAQREAENAANVGNQNLQNRYAYQMEAYQNGQARVIGVEGGNVIVQRGDQMDIIPLTTTADSVQALRDVTTALGQDSVQAQQLSYQVLIDQDASVETIAGQVVRDLVDNGLAAQIFPEMYTQAMEEAQQLFATGGEGAAMIQQVNNHVAGSILYFLLANNDWNWIPAAAAVGNYGAQYIFQQGQLNPNG